MHSLAVLLGPHGHELRLLQLDSLLHHVPCRRLLGNTSGADAPVIPAVQGREDGPDLDRVFARGQPLSVRGICEAARGRKVRGKCEVRRPRRLVFQVPSRNLAGFLEISFVDEDFGCASLEGVRHKANHSSPL